MSSHNAVCRSEMNRRKKDRMQNITTANKVNIWRKYRWSRKTEQESSLEGKKCLEARGLKCAYIERSSIYEDVSDAKINED